MSTRVVLYARVSTEDQVKHGYSLASQLDACRKHAEENGLQVVAEVRDEAVSGATLDRPGLDHIREMADRGEIDLLLVYDVDRLARKTVYTMLIEEELAKAGVSVHYVLGNYDDTDEGRLQKQIRAAIAEYERAKMRERANRGKRQAVKSGKVLVFARPPYGYRVRDGMLEPREPEAEAVRLIFDWYVNDGVPIREITRRLSDAQIPTAADRPEGNSGLRKTRGYGQWARSSVSRILSNETYAGVWHYQKWQRKGVGDLRRRSREDWLPVDVPAIVSRETWLAAQKRRQRNKAMAKRNSRNQYLLSGYAFCGTCGARIYSFPCKGKLYYRCSRRKRGECVGEACELPSFRADWLDRKVWDYVRSLLLDPAALTRGLRAQQAEQESAVTLLRERLAMVTNLISQREAQLRKLLDLYLTSDFARDMLIERRSGLVEAIRALEEERLDLQAQLDASTITDDQIEALDDFARQIRASIRIAQADFGAQRRIVDLLGLRVMLTQENGEKVAYVQCLIDGARVSVAPTTSARCARQRPTPPAPASRAPAP